MSARSPRVSAGLACALLCALAAPALAKDASVEKRLEARGIKFELDDDGDYKVVFSYDKEQRSQLAFISGSTEEAGGILVREIWAPAGRVKEDGISGAMALKLLEESQGKKLGSWELAGNALIYVIKLPDSVDAVQLETAVKIAAEVADDKEIELSGKKDAF